VLGCRCGKCRSIIDHKRLGEAERCAQRIIAKEQQEHAS
jgi:hypothetical protein